MYYNVYIVANLNPETVSDQTVPRIDRCASPPPVVSHDQYARVEWENPLFSDNSDDELQIKSSHQPGLFPQGTTDVTYTAYDTSGNNNTCTLEIRVIRRWITS